MRYSWNIKRELSEETVRDIITTAIEGGINYWAGLDNSKQEYQDAIQRLKQKHEELYYESIVIELWNNHDSLTLYDLDDDTRYTLSKDDFVKGCELYETHTGKSIVKAFDDSDFDANDADMIFQYAIFGEVIFG